jgi:hypothetical protein
MRSLLWKGVPVGTGTRMTSKVADMVRLVVWFGGCWA